MMKHFTLLLLTVFTFYTVASAQTAGKKSEKKPAAKPAAAKETEKPAGYNIHVKVIGLKNTDIYLGRYYADKQYLVDTTHLDNKGEGVFTGTKPLNRGLYMVVQNREILFETLVANDQDFYIEGDTNYDHKTMVAKNSFENEKFVEYQKVVGEAGKRHYECQEKLEKATADNNAVLKAEAEACIKECATKVADYKKQYITQYPDHYLAHVFKGMTDIDVPEGPKEDSLFKYRYYKAHYWDNIDFADEGMIGAPTGLLKRMLDVYMDKLTYQEPDSLIKACDIAIAKASKSKEIERYFIVSLTNKYETSQIMCQDKVFVHLAQEYYCKGRAWWADTGLVRKICEESRKMMPTLCNEIARDLNMEDTAGVLHRLYDVKANYTILFFYDPTCSHCKKVIPVVNDIYNKHKNRGVAVYAVSTESKYKEWMDLMRQRPDLGGWINVCKTSRYAPWPYYKQDYNIVANPTVFILDKNKKIIARKIDEKNMLTFLEHMMVDDGSLKKEEMSPPPVFDDKSDAAGAHDNHD